MSRKLLLVSAASPYPMVTDGCSRLVLDYLTRIFAGDEAWFLHARPGDWAPLALYRDGTHVAGAPGAPALLARGFDFVFFIGFKTHEVTSRLAAELPSFCLTDTYPHTDLPAGLFRGILAHRSDGPRRDLLLVGGSYDEAVFHPRRSGEELVLAVGRIHPDKNQLELVAGYREAVFARTGLPLILAGGATDPDYFARVEPYVDGVAVTLGGGDADAGDGGRPWLSATEIAALCNRARLFVSASPRESFGIALVEALACGTTCVVNGDYRGFAAGELASRVYGHVAGKRGSTLDLVARALEADVRIDASGWAERYSLAATRRALLPFLAERLDERRPHDRP